MATDLLEGEILEQHRGLVGAEEEHRKEHHGKEKMEESQGCTDAAGCSEGCESHTGDQRKQKHPKKEAGWFAPPAARR